VKEYVKKNTIVRMSLAALATGYIARIQPIDPITQVELRASGPAA